MPFAGTRASDAQAPGHDASCLGQGKDIVREAHPDAARLVEAGAVTRVAGHVEVADHELLTRRENAQGVLEFVTDKLKKAPGAGRRTALRRAAQIVEAQLAGIEAGLPKGWTARRAPASRRAGTCPRAPACASLASACDIWA